MKHILMTLNTVLTFTFFQSIPLWAWSSEIDLLERATEDVASFQLRGDGRYDVICTNGTYEIVTKDDILSNKICLGPAPIEFNILSVQKRPDGKFNVLCSDHTSQIATADELRMGKVCSGSTANFGFFQEPTGNASFSAGWLTGFKIRIPKKGTLTHLGVFLSQAGQVKLQLGFYSDKKGFPGEMISSTGIVTGIKGRNEFALSDSKDVESGDYWIFWNFLDSAQLGTVSGKTARRAISFSSSSLPSTLNGLKFINAEDAFSWCFYSVVRGYSTF